ncbi:hypothetical protein K474DRAFT_79403 [Panus rudis PR-1116 ss-1]|nr:hypothetical protein K474DRAFT_79403 [Panus rudis PR-1116 ss-1]
MWAAREATLSRCSQVCRAWHQYTKPLLFHTLFIPLHSEVPKVQLLVSLFEEYPEVHQLVKCLVIHVIPHRDPDVVLNIEPFVNLRTVYLGGNITIRSSGPVLHAWVAGLGTRMPIIIDRCPHNGHLRLHLFNSNISKAKHQVRNISFPLRSLVKRHHRVYGGHSNERADLMLSLQARKHCRGTLNA